MGDGKFKICIFQFDPFFVCPMEVPVNESRKEAGFVVSGYVRDAQAAAALWLDQFGPA